MIRLTPLLLLLWTSSTIMAQRALTTESGWPYEVVTPGRGSLLDSNKGIETHNQLVDADRNVLVSTYAVGIPDYQLVKELSPPFQAACKVRGEVSVVAEGSLPNDGKIIDDVRKFD